MPIPNLHTNWKKYTGANGTEPIIDPEFLFDHEISRSVVPWAFPDNPFNYTEFLKADGLKKKYGKNFGSNKNIVGKKLAIIGAGAAGLCAAYELIRAEMGLDITVIEATERTGGRLYSKPFPTWDKTIVGKFNPLVEIGAMRFPPTHKTMAYYIDKFKFSTQPFPNPHVVDTVMNYGGKSYTWLKSEASPPGPFRAVGEKLGLMMGPILAEITRVWDDPAARTAEWNEIVEKYQNKSFYDALAETGLFSESEMAVFGALGVGTGGFRGLFRINFIEVLRIELGHYDKNQVLINSGSESIITKFLAGCNKPTAGKFKVVKDLAITAIRRGTKQRNTEGKIELFGGNPSKFKQPGAELTRNDSRATKLGEYDAVILTPTTHAIQMNMDIGEGIFTPDVNRAIRNIHLMNSTKLAVYPHPSFWEKAAECGIAAVTLTELAIGQTYFLNYGSGPGAPISEDLLPQNVDIVQTKDVNIHKEEKEDDISIPPESVSGALGKLAKEDLAKVQKWTSFIIEKRMEALSPTEKEEITEDKVKLAQFEQKAEEDAVKRLLQARDLPTKEGVIFLSYSWGEDSTKFTSRTKEQAVNLAVENLIEIYKEYPGAEMLFNNYLRPLSTHQNANPGLPTETMEWINWEAERYTNGAFKLNYSGQQEDIMHLFYQYAAYNPIKHERYNPSGVFLAGDGISWAGGWIEGALHTGINAATAVGRYLAGDLNLKEKETKEDELEDELEDID